MLLVDAVDAFLISCRADGLAVPTVKWYRSLLDQFRRAYASCGLDSFTSIVLREYIVSLRERIAYTDAPQKPVQNHKMSGFTVDSHVVALHSFWAWAAREYVLPNPMTNIRRPKRRTPEPKFIEPSDFVKLFDVTGSGAAGVRDRALLAFLADTGCRLAGLVGLKLVNLDVDAGRAVVLEKGSKTRKVVFTKFTARLLIAWFAVRSSRSEYVFTSVTLSHEQISPDGVQQILKRLKHRARVEGRVNPHSFRHAFAREYLKNGGDIVTLARLLGHADVNTTAAYYAIFSQDELAELHEKYSPLKGIFR